MRERSGKTALIPSAQSTGPAPSSGGGTAPVPAAVALQLLCCSSDAFVLEMAQWVTGSMYFGDEAFLSYRMYVA